MVDDVLYGGQGEGRKPGASLCTGERLSRWWMTWRAWRIGPYLQWLLPRPPSSTPGTLRPQPHMPHQP